MARWLFHMRGVAVSTREIAQALEISESVLYQRFSCREELLFAALAPPRVSVDDVLGPRSALDELESQEDVRLWLHGVARALVTLCADVLPLHWLLLGHSLQDEERYVRWWRADPTRAVTHELSNRLLELARRGLIGGAPHFDTAQLLMAAAREVVYHELALPDTYPMPARLERLIDPMFDVLWAGLSPRRRYGEWSV
jgi:AcrR family transcriptional regulator